MRKAFIIGLAAGLCLAYQQATAQAGMLNRLKQKAESAAEGALDRAISGKKAANGSSSADSGYSGSSEGSGTAANSGRARNKGGEGLVTTPPDVKQHLGDAEGAFKSKNYNEARYAVQQAMLGVEMEIGQKILKSLPDVIANLKKDEKTDQVTSMGWGWAGLTILRQYTDQQEKELRVTVANNTAMLTAMNYFLANGSYAQTTGGEQNWKQTKVKGHRAVIEYDADAGYKLSVPLGQSSLLVYEGVNFKNEQEIMAAAGAVDIDNIKKMLGEQ
ncbi:hypothetical protein [Botryobacter ruber]|uniref:hypothetical protein n=1 Tax=Botryobacter ruber TaxID=2171629 RepID=UPI000F64FCE3|nr:hypothetical protein [Botryobacter ruber]